MCPFCSTKYMLLESNVCPNPACNELYVMKASSSKYDVPIENATEFNNNITDDHIDIPVEE